MNLCNSRFFSLAWVGLRGLLDCKWFYAIKYTMEKEKRAGNGLQGIVEQKLKYLIENLVNRDKKVNNSYSWKQKIQYFTPDILSGEFISNLKVIS